MLKIFGITMRNGEIYRLSVKATEAMNEAWLTFLNEGSDEPMTFEQAMKESCYLSNNKGFLVMEIEVDMMRNIYQPMYYFDKYEEFDIEIEDDEKQQLVDFINEWGHKVPDNEELLVGDSEWLDALSNDIPWKKDVR